MTYLCTFVYVNVIILSYFPHTNPIFFPSFPALFSLLRAHYLFSAAPSHWPKTNLPLNLPVSFPSNQRPTSCSTASIHSYTRQLAELKRHPKSHVVSHVIKTPHVTIITPHVTIPTFHVVKQRKKGHLCSALPRGHSPRGHLLIHLSHSMTSSIT